MRLLLILPTWTNFSLDAAGSSLSLGSNDNVFKADGDVGIQLGDATFEDAKRFCIHFNEVKMVAVF